MLECTIFCSLWLCVQNKTFWWFSCSYEWYFAFPYKHRTARRLRLAAHPENSCFSNEERVCTTIIKQNKILNEWLFPCCLLQELFSRISQVLQQKVGSLQDLSSVQEPSSCSSIDTKKIQTGAWYMHAVAVVMSHLKLYEELVETLAKISFSPSEVVRKRTSLFPDSDMPQICISK